MTRREQESFAFMANVPSFVPGISWEKSNGPLGHGTCGASYCMLVDGKPNGGWVKHCGHPTALRPYYVATSGGLILEQKFGRLADAKAALVQAEAWR